MRKIIIDGCYGVMITKRIELLSENISRKWRAILSTINILWIFLPALTSCSLNETERNVNEKPTGIVGLGSRVPFASANYAFETKEQH